MKRVLLAALTLLMVTGCGNLKLGFLDVHGTEIGNPMNPNDPNQGVLVQGSAAIMQAYCNVVTHCNPSLTMASCESQFQSTTDIGPSVGLPSSFTAAYSSILAGESTGSIVSNLTAVSNCVTNISQMACPMTAVSPGGTVTIGNVSTNIPASATGCSSALSLR